MAVQTQGGTLAGWSMSVTIGASDKSGLYPADVSLSSE